MLSLQPLRKPRIQGDFRAAAVIPVPFEDLWDEVVQEWNFFFQDGLGPQVVAAFQAPNGDFFTLTHLFWSPDAQAGVRTLDIETIHQSITESETLDWALSALDQTTSDLLWLADPVHTSRPHSAGRQR